MNSSMQKSKIITIDFDGTVVTHSFPDIGKDIGADIVLEKLVDYGHRLILSTMRCNDPEGNFEQNIYNGYKVHSGMYLEQAVNWFREKISLCGVFKKILTKRIGLLLQNHIAI